MADLTPRCREVLCLATLSNREIAQRLGINHHTVKNYFTFVRMALDLPAIDRAAQRLRFLTAALERGVVALDEIELPPPPPGWCWERVEQMRAAARREMATDYEG